jgi:hypothetical protein
VARIAPYFAGYALFVGLALGTWTVASGDQVLPQLLLSATEANRQTTLLLPPSV